MKASLPGLPGFIRRLMQGLLAFRMLEPDVEVVILVGQSWKPKVPHLFTVANCTVSRYFQLFLNSNVLY
jgi:hypothetical protein